MSEAMKLLLSLSISGTLLLLFVLGLKPLYRNKFSRRWQYYIWIIVVLRFLLPFTPDTTLVGSLFQIAETFDPSAITNADPLYPNPPVTRNTDSNTDNNNNIDYICNTGSDSDTNCNNDFDYNLNKQTQKNRNITATADAHHPPDIQTGLLFVWICTALVLLVRKIMLYHGFLQYIKANSTEVSDIRILNLLSDCAEKRNIRTNAELYHNRLIHSPMLIGFFRPCIVLPDRELQEQDLSYVFMHELIHYRHRDMFYKWLVQIVVCVHWFNPFVYLLEKEINQSCELSCDEAVLSMLDDTARRAYGDMLISFMKSEHLYRSAPASITLTEGTAHVKHIKERLGAIMKFQKKSKPVIIFTAIFTAAVCFCFFATGAYAAPSANNEELISVPDTAGTLEGSSTYTYVHRAFYSDSYIIEMGWNLNDTIMGKEHYTDGKAITLEDESTFFVYFGALFFGDTETDVINYLNDQNAISAVGKLIDSLRNNPLPNYPPLEAPLITNITYVGENLPALAEEYYESGNTTAFSAVFPVLIPALQTEYCNRAYNDDKITLFSSIVPYMERADIMLYADQSEQDGKTNFLFTVIPYMTPDDLNRYAENYYEANDTARFAAIVFYMTEPQKQEWLTKAQADNKNTFSAFLSANILQ